MRYLLTAIVVSFAVLVTTPGFAQTPNPGIYSTNPLPSHAGSILPGRASEAWCNGAPGQPGNTENAMSWDGAALGTEWHLWGMAIDENGATLIDSYTSGPYEYVTYSTSYDGGEFWLSKNGDWGDGTTDFTGWLDNYYVTITLTYLGGVLAGATSNITASGYFDTDPEYVVEFIIANALLVSHPGSGGLYLPDYLLADYPSLQCSAVVGEQFNVCCVTMSFQPPVGTENTSWGALKSLYK